MLYICGLKKHIITTFFLAGDSSGSSPSVSPRCYFSCFLSSPLVSSSPLLLFPSVIFCFLLSWFLSSSFLLPFLLLFFFYLLFFSSRQKVSPVVSQRWRLGHVDLLLLTPPHSLPPPPSHTHIHTHRNPYLNRVI